MRFRSHTPREPLSHFIGYVWQLEDAPAHAREQILPSGTIELVINLRENEFRIYDAESRCHRHGGAMVSGAYKRPFIIDPAQHACVVGVHFRAGGAFPFLGASPGELADSHVDLEQLWGRAGRRLRERLCEAKSAGERFRLLEEALLAALVRSRSLHPAVGFALEAFRASFGQRPVMEVAEEAGLSQRRFIQAFTEQVGMPPKLFCRVQRFQRAMSLARVRTGISLGELALDCGYYDQSHMVRDFQEFCSLSPTDYLRQQSDRVKENHIALA